MAGPFWGSIASGYYDGQDQATSREMRRLQLKREKDSDAQEQRVNSNMGAGMDAMQQLSAPPQQAGPQAPPPGQGSQPPQPPQQQRPPQPQGQMGPPPMGGSPIQGVTGGQFGGPQQGPQQPPMARMPPYQSPQAPQPPPQQGGQVPPPPQQQQGQQGMPQGGQPDLRTLMMTIKKNNPGLDPQTIFSVANRFAPMLSMEGKMQLQQANSQIHMMTAQAAEERAQTGSRGEDRRGETAAGTNAGGAAAIDLKQAQAEAARARAAATERKAKLATGQGSGAGGGYSKDDLTFLAEQAIAGDLSVYQNAGRGAAANRSIRKEVIRLRRGSGGTGADQAASNAEYQGIRAGERTAGTAAANIGMAKNEASQMANLVLEASKKVPRTESMDLNKLLLAGEKRTGNPEVVAYGAALNSFINTYARAINPKGAPTEGDKKHAREMISDGMSSGQIDSVIAQLLKEMDAASKAPGAVRKEMRKAVTGKDPDAPKPTAQDIAYAKANPKSKAQFVAHFGMEP